MRKDDGQWLSALSFGIIQTDGRAHPILPATRDRVLHIPGKNGVAFFGSDLAEMRFLIPCEFQSTNLTDLGTLAAALAEFLIDENGRPALIEIRFDGDEESAWNVYYSGALELRRTLFDGAFDLPLMAPDPLPHTPESES
jgi:hypothetical protein